MNSKKLPGEYSFTTIRDNNVLYVDKTKYIYNLLVPPKGDYFLSRPRRFGKTLLLSTLEELFTGDCGRFKGLWINDESDYAFKKHPVVSLSLSMTPTSPELVQESILADLRRIADENKVKVTGSTPDVYLGGLVTALDKRHGAPVAVLIDEYDAPVTRCIDDIKLASANAKVLHDFFAALKQGNILKHLRFTMVIGITRYAMTSMDSEPNQLIDISLDPRYTGICGFTLDEFDSYFADHMKAALASFKEKKEKSAPVDIESLRARILRWYDGYDWGDGAKILNPYSIIRFFDTNEFDHHWIRTGRPGHLSTMIQKRPLDSLKRNFEPYIAQSLLKTGLDQLEIIPALFHSGYLTVDTVEVRPVEDPKTHEIDYLTFYNLKLPNLEVSSVYNNDVFQAIFDLDSYESPTKFFDELKTAFLKKDAQAVSDMFNSFFSTFTYHQKVDNETTFHMIVQGMLSAMGFELGSKLPGSRGCFDLCVKLKNRIFLIIELKYCASPKSLGREEEEGTLAALFLNKLPLKEVNKIWAGLAVSKLPGEITTPILRNNPPGAKRDELLSDATSKFISTTERNRVLALEARNILPNSDIVAALNEKAATLKKKATKKYLPEERIDAILSKAANMALRAIASKDYYGVLALKAKKIIDLGLAIYDHKVMAIFGPEAPATRSRQKPVPTKVSAPEAPAPLYRRKPNPPELPSPRSESTASQGHSSLPPTHTHPGI